MDEDSKVTLRKMNFLTTMPWYVETAPCLEAEAVSNKKPMTGEMSLGIEYPILYPMTSGFVMVSDDFERKP